MFHSFDQVKNFVVIDEECIKCMGYAYAVFSNAKGKVDHDKAMELCHKIAIKLARIYNKKVTKEKTYSKVFTPATMDRLKYFVYFNSIDAK